jgi:putative transposase
MIDRGAAVTVKRQAELLELSRSNVYYQPRPVSERDLLLMRRIDELHLEAPYYGARKLAVQLRREGHSSGRKHVRTLMRRMGIEALYRKPRTSIPAREAAIYPYLLENRAIERPNEAWASDITYVPMDDHQVQNQSAVEMRDDVLVYSTDVLSEGVALTGEVQVVVYVSSSTPDADLAIKLVEVYPDGTARRTT